MIEFLIEQELPFVVVLTKADKLSASQRKQRLQELQEELPYADQILQIPFSAQTGEGVDQIKEVIAQIEQEDLEESDMQTE